MTVGGSKARTGQGQARLLGCKRYSSTDCQGWASATGPGKERGSKGWYVGVTEDRKAPLSGPAVEVMSHPVSIANSTPFVYFIDHKSLSVDELDHQDSTLRDPKTAFLDSPPPFCASYVAKACERPCREEGEPESPHFQEKKAHIYTE